MKNLGLALVFALMAACIGCGSEGLDEPRGSGDTAEVSIALTTVPAMVACIKVQATVNGTALAPVLLPVMANASSATLSVGRLPTGMATFSAGAFSQACNDATINTTAIPTWLSDTVPATLTLGAPSIVGLTFHLNSAVTVNANFVKSAASLSAGVRSTYAVMNDGTVKAWGSTGAGIGTLVVPTDFPGATSVAEVAVSTLFACLRTTAGAVQCWGILPGAAVSTPTPTAVMLPGPALQIEAGSNHICAIIQSSTTNNPIFCWGNNAFGQLGNGSTTNSNTPVQALLPAGDTSAYALAAGVDTTCALTSGAHVFCWGRGLDGQIGDGAFLNRTRPTMLSLFGGFKSIAMGGFSGCVIRVDGRVFCWGQNVGDGTEVERPGPVELPSISDATAVTLAPPHGCLLNRAGSVLCWGGGLGGATGIPSGDPRFAPTVVAGLNLPAVDVEAGEGGHTCAILQDGSVWCWGGNETGQLGDGTIVPRFVPTRAKIN